MPGGSAKHRMEAPLAPEACGTKVAVFLLFKSEMICLSLMSSIVLGAVMTFSLAVKPVKDRLRTIVLLKTDAYGKVVQSFPSLLGKGFFLILPPTLLSSFHPVPLLNVAEGWRRHNSLSFVHVTCLGSLFSVLKFPAGCSVSCDSPLTGHQFQNFSAFLHSV